MNDLEIMNKTKITSLYDQFKDTPKKLKIVCDWDEVIQPCEFYAEWLTLKEWMNPNILYGFPEYFSRSWKGVTDMEVKYSPYGSRLISKEQGENFHLSAKQQQFKNSWKKFYQEAPFLTIAKELLILIKAGKVERLIFLTAFDAMEFSTGDPRKRKIFQETFGKFSNCFLQLIGFDSEIQGQTKADWIKENAKDFDIFIDDNPIICRSLADCQGCKIKGGCSSCGERCGNCSFLGTVITPYYPAITEQHHKDVLLVKQEVSNLTKEDFK